MENNFPSALNVINSMRAHCDEAAPDSDGARRESRIFARLSLAITVWFLEAKFDFQFASHRTRQTSSNSTFHPKHNRELIPYRVPQKSCTRWPKHKLQKHAPHTHTHIDDSVNGLKNETNYMLGQLATFSRLRKTYGCAVCREAKGIFSQYHRSRVARAAKSVQHIS